MTDEMVAVWGQRVILTLIGVSFLACVAFVVGYAPVKRKVDVGKHMLRTSVLLGAMFFLTVLFQYVTVPLRVAVAAQVIVFGATAVEMWYRFCLMMRHRRRARERAREEMRQRLALAACGTEGAGDD